MGEIRILWRRAKIATLSAAVAACGGGGGGTDSPPPPQAPATAPTISQLAFTPTEVTSATNPAQINVSGSIRISDPDGDVVTVRIVSASGSVDIPAPSTNRTAYTQTINTTVQLPGATTTHFSVQVIDSRGLVSNSMSGSIGVRLNVTANANYTNVAAGGSTFGLSMGTFGEGLCQPVASGTYTITNIEYADCIPDALTVTDPTGRSTRWTKYLGRVELCGGTPLPMDFSRWGAWTYTDGTGNQFYWTFSSTSNTASVETALKCPG